MNESLPLFDDLFGTTPREPTERAIETPPKPDEETVAVKETEDTAGGATTVTETVSQAPALRIQPADVKPTTLPPFLARVFGQERPKQVLARFIKEHHLPHALLFYGPDGCGKQVFALELARHLNCKWGPLTACGECPSCRQFESLQHTSFFLAFPTKANEGEVDKKEILEDGEVRISRRYSPKTDDEIAAAVEETAKDNWTPLRVPGATQLRIITIRFLRQWAQFGTWLGQGRKVAILAQADRMNEETSNALLKILEEPPSDTLLLLICKSPDDLLPTIQSRCQAVRLDPLPAEIIERELQAMSAEQLRRSTPLTTDEAKEIAELAEGNFLAARAAAAEDAVVLTETIVEFLLGCVIASQRREMLKRIEPFSRTRNADDVENFLIRLGLFLRDALRLQLHKGSGLPDNIITRGAALIKRLRKFADFANGRDLTAAVEEVVRAQDILRRSNPQFPLLFYALSFRLNRILTD